LYADTVINVNKKKNLLLYIRVCIIRFQFYLKIRRICVFSAIRNISDISNFFNLNSLTI
jgi:hypothetical protein